MNSSEKISEPDRDARIVFDLMDGFRASKTVFTAVSLGVFDRLHAVPSSCEELALGLGCKPDPLERVLGACTAFRLVRKENGIYYNEPAATRFLRIQSPETLTGYILYADRITYHLWAHLEDAVREGTHRWEQVFGRREGIFDHFFASEKEKQLFLAGMHGNGLLSSPVAVSAFDLGKFHRLVDVAGGTGHLVIAACRYYPHLNGAIFDLPAVASVSAEYVKKAGLESRIEILSGDFFVDSLPPADLYTMGRVLHDWSDEKVNFLLSKIFDHLPEKGGLLICEKILNETKDGPASAYLQSLNMLVCTEGKERTASEYEALVRKVGFSKFLFCRTGQPVDVMLALKE